ncbi:MAG: BlaI/MecI/CopY family transcriptional regulator [Cyanobacteria bacterium J06632_22]
MPTSSHYPYNLSLGPLEAEILQLIWQLEPTTARAIHESILTDIDRELTYSSVATVLRRLESKGWVLGRRVGRAFVWQARVSPQQAEVLRSQQQLHAFLNVSNPDIVAAFADTLDEASISQLEAITERIRAAKAEQEAQS